MDSQRQLLNSQLEQNKALLSKSLHDLLKQTASKSRYYALVALGAVFALMLVNSLLGRSKFRRLKSNLLKSSANQDIVVVQAKEYGILALIKWHISSFLLVLAKNELEKLLKHLLKKKSV
jgi:hypothetical protein